ncbi:MAG TPA: endolytic transglycosylase MltG [Anaeromyxobacteraceae bacterium]|nr:endolytic transglycosylase MltG [Anaeromyxobacteraceae bacterium]
MRRFLSLVALLALAVAVAAGLFAWNAWRELERFRTTPYGSSEEKVVEVPPGSSPRAVVRSLARAGVLSADEPAWRYLHYVKRDPRPLKAGEYAFTGPLTPDEVLERLYKGEIRLHRFTVPEGLRLDEIAEVIGASGLARSEDVAALGRDASFARSLEVPFDGLEGYLFPDTYAFAKGVTARQILEAMVERFRVEWGRAEAARAPGVSLTAPQAVTLASIIEKETGQPEERPRISCVFHNRLARHIPLATDPTVMYATFLRTGRWSKNITRADLKTPHPYNTYLVAGLPPGPIASPGAAALQAALAPSACDDLFFVSRNDGTHVFCPDIHCHEAAVRTWQVEYFRKKRQ